MTELAILSMDSIIMEIPESLIQESWCQLGGTSKADLAIPAVQMLLDRVRHYPTITAHVHISLVLPCLVEPILDP